MHAICRSLIGAASRLALFLTSIAIALIAAELLLRWSDGLPVLALRLPSRTPAPPEAPLAELARRLPLAERVDPSWIDDYPPALANRTAPTPEMRAKHDRGVRRGELESDWYREWNSQYLERFGCQPDAHVWSLPLPIWAFDVKEPDAQPIFRQPLGSTTPLGLVTNRFGWRGPEIQIDKPEHTIRIAFVGASTTIGQHWFPFSYPEYVIHWLNLWAQQEGVAVNFDGINAGREGLASPGFVAITQRELLPMEPDLVVYYEGANQFQLTSLVESAPKSNGARAITLLPQSWGDSTFLLRPYFALVRHFEEAATIAIMGDGREPDKPAYNLTWPNGLDERDPDIARTDLPLQLPLILSGLNSIRTSLSSQGTELAVSSFVWFVEDGLRVDSNNLPLYTFLNQRYWPYRYRDLRRLADFQNRVLARYASAHDLLFIDEAEVFPKEARFFLDGVHFTPEGTRLQGWIAFNALIPRVRERIASGAWPRADRSTLHEHPHIRPPQRFDGCADFLRSRSPDS